MSIRYVIYSIAHMQSGIRRHAERPNDHAVSGESVKQAATVFDTEETRRSCPPTRKRMSARSH